LTVPSDIPIRRKKQDIPVFCGQSYFLRIGVVGWRLERSSSSREMPEPMVNLWLWMFVEFEQKTLF